MGHLPAQEPACKAHTADNNTNAPVCPDNKHGQAKYYLTAENPVNSALERDACVPRKNFNTRFHDSLAYWQRLARAYLLTN